MTENLAWYAPTRPNQELRFMLNRCPNCGEVPTIEFRYLPHENLIDLKACRRVRCPKCGLAGDVAIGVVTPDGSFAIESIDNYITSIADWNTQVPTRFASMKSLYRNDFGFSRDGGGGE